MEAANGFRPLLCGWRISFYYRLCFGSSGTREPKSSKVSRVRGKHVKSIDIFPEED